MKKFYLIILVFTTNIFAQSTKDVQNIVSNYDIAKIKEKIIFFNTLELKEKQKAYDKAVKMNWPLFIKNSDGTTDELVNLTVDGHPLYLSSNNDRAAKFTRTNFINTGGSLGLNLNGQGMVARVWDGGKVRSTHNLLSPRITVMDDAFGTTFSDHASHVTGTIVATNTVAATKGMAYQATAKTYNWTDDESEVLTEILDGMLISNHSYGVPLINNTSGVQLPEWYVGSYSQDAKNWDEISYLSPYYLMVTSAGNNGNDTNSGALTIGFDKMNGNKLCKNNLSVANANDASVNATTGVFTIGAGINTSSSQGPADDGRIKPDITGNGTTLTSSIGTSDSAVASLTGTSMASPNVAGSLLLVQQHQKNLTNGFMKSATLKGLATHTADDSGQIGPDPVFGWGALNVKKCVEALNENGLKALISEESLNQGQTYTLNVNSDGLGPLIASITWTDVPGIPNINTTLVNNTTPALVNDLDIRVTRGGVTSYPWRLQSLASSPAIRTGDNSVDNVENIKIDAPTAGAYTIKVTHKGNLVGAKQDFSLVVTGVTSNFALTSTSTDLIVCSNQIANYTFNYKQTGSGITNFVIEGLPAGATGVLNNTSLSANGSLSLNISNLANVAPGIYNVGIRGTSSTETETRYRTLRIYSPIFSPTLLTYPNHLQDDVAGTTTISWVKNINDETYTLEVATDSGFSNIINNIVNITGTSNKVYGLTPNTQYYWRVTPQNRCGSGIVSNATLRSFKTGNVVCSSTFIATNFSNASIANVADSEASVPITVSGGMKISDINVSLKINHEYTSDMFVSLIGPTSIGSPEVYILSNTCPEPSSTPPNLYDDVNGIFDDSALTVVCSSTPPSISGTVRPFGELSDFNNKLADGVWTLKVSDPYNGDGGNIESASMTICGLAPAVLSNTEFELNNLNIYPNPSNGIVNINLSSKLDGKTTASLYDIQGRSVLTKELMNQNEILNINNLQNGVYLLVIKNGDSETTKKIVLSK